MPMSSGSKPIRVQFDFSPESLKKLDRLKDQVGAATRAEVVRRALSLYARVASFQGSDGDLCIRRRNGQIAELVVAL